MKNVYFRVDSSIKIGTGHLKRCLVLAEELKALGCQITFLKRNLEGNLSTEVLEHGFEFYFVEPNIEPVKDSLDFFQSQDAESCIEKIVKISGKADVLIVDHYSLDANWQLKIKPYCDKVIVIDDLANRNHQCDILIDSNPKSISLYDKLVPENCDLLIGLQYAILRREFSREQGPLKQQTNQVQNVLVFMGGNDPRNISSFVISVLTLQKYSQLKVKVITGSNNPHLDVLRKQCQSEDIELLVAINNMTEMYLWADIVIGAGGTSVWERMALGVPSITFQLAFNQHSICNYLQENNLAYHYGDISVLDSNRLEHLIDHVLSDTDGLNNMRQSSLLAISGGGARAIAKKIVCN